ncbi:MAG: glutathione S-transferase [Pseudomonadota bacterium]
MAETDRLEFIGSPGSPYSRKMLAALRYRQIPYKVRWSSHDSEPESYPQPKVKLFPTFYFPNADGDLDAVVDSTPIIRRLEHEHTGRSIIPPDPELSFYNFLIEDFADEWLTKAMFHYRWYHEPDRVNAGPMLIFWRMTTTPADTAQELSDFITKRQFERLYVVGSNDVTATTIEESYQRLVDILDALLQKKGFVLGARPSSADFAIYGQLTQLGIVEPSSAAEMRRRSARLRAWIDVIEDLSGLIVSDDDWFTPQEARDALAPLLAEIGRVYAPFLLANAGAAMSGEKSFETIIDGRAWTQPTFPYQAKCLQVLRELHGSLPNETRAHVDATLQGTGCPAMFA